MRKLTKKIWYEDVLWNVVKVYCPNKYDRYILLRRKSDAVHAHNIPSVEMVLLDTGSDVFYPDISRVRKAMKQKKEYHQMANEKDTELEAEWLDVAINDCY